MRVLMLSQGRKIEDQLDFDCSFRRATSRGKPVELLNIPFVGYVEKHGADALYTIVDKTWGVYHPMPKHWHGSVSISGPWQSEQYFAHHFDQILKDFTLKNGIWLNDDPVARLIRTEENSIFLHVRSYKDIPLYKDGSYALPIEYYHNALKYLGDKLGGGKVFVFSDDLQWAVDRLGEAVTDNNFEMVPVWTDNSRLPRGKYSSSYLRDFSLMRLCRHGIVADSTFSWWAGWLGENEQLNYGRAVIRIRPDKGNAEGPDFYPSRWVSVAAW